MEVTPEKRKEIEEKLKNMSPEELLELQKQQCVFCQIVAGKIPAKKIYEDEICIVALDINPASRGHIIIVPKEHYVIFPQVPDEIIGHLYKISKKLSKILLRSLKIKGTTIFVANGPMAGQKAQHVMLHLIPRKEGDGIIKFEEKLIDKEMLNKVKIAIQPKLSEILGIKIEEQKTLDLQEESFRKVEKEEKKEIEQEPKENKKVEEVEGDVSLDDIANLFK